MSVSLNSYITETEDRIIDIPNTSIADDLHRDNDINVTSFNVNPQFLYYVNTDGNPFVYLGGGPFMEYSNSKRTEYDLRYTNNYIRYYNIDKLEYSKTSFGFLALAGAEIFLNDYLSLHAEYSATYYYSKEENVLKRKIDFKDDSGDSADKSSRKIDGYFFNQNPILFGLSVYF